MKTERLLNEYCEYIMGVKGAREGTANTYRYKLQKAFREMGGRKGGFEPQRAQRKKEDIETERDRGEFPELCEKDLGDYVLGLRRKVSIASQRITVTALKSFYGWYSKAYRKKDISQALAPIKEYIKHADVLRVEEVEKLILAAGRDNFLQARNAAIICVLADTGIRVSELCELRISDISLEENQFLMNVPATKSRRSRIVPFCFQQEGSIVAELFSYYWLQVKFKKGWAGNDYLFQRESVYWKKVPGGWKEGAAKPWEGGKLHRNAINDMLGRLKRITGIERKVTAHSFRHFYATYLAVRGMDPIKIQQRLGHASLDRTMIYVHYADIIKGDSAKDNPLSKVKAGWTGALKAVKSLGRM